MLPAAIFAVRAPLTPGPLTTRTCAFLPALRTRNVVGPDDGVVGETRRLVSENVTLTVAEIERSPEAASATPVTPKASSEAASKACTRDIVLPGRTVSLSFRDASVWKRTRKMESLQLCKRTDNVGAAAAGSASVFQAAALPDSAAFRMGLRRGAIARCGQTTREGGVWR